MIQRSVLVLAVSTALLAGVASAEIERQHTPHVHGVATGNLAIDQGDLRLELEIPGVNLIGFEHAPRNDEQQAALDGALAFLRAAEWLQTDPRGGCELASINAHTHGFGSEGHYHGDYDHSHHQEHSHEHGHHDHGHAHDHSHGHDHHHHDHSEFHIVVGVECEHPERLGWIDLRLFDDYPANERMDIDVLTETLATQARLTPRSQRISLR